MKSRELLHRVAFTSDNVFKILAILVGLLMSAFVVAKPLPFLKSEDTTYQLKDDPLVEFLQTFLGDQGLRSVLSEELQKDARTLNGLRRGQPQKIYSSIINSNGLVSYYDGLTVYIYKAEEMRREFLVVPVENARMLQRVMGRMHLSDSENYTRVDSETGLVEISGVPRYVSQVQRLVGVVAERDTSEDMAFHYFPLKYAWANDRTFTVGNQQVQVPGVASILQQAVYGGGVGQTFGRGQERTLPSRATSVKGRGLASKGAQEKGARILTLQDGKDYAVMESERSQQGDNSLMGFSYDIGSGPGIVADTQHNAIIVRDYPDRIPLYKELITALDIPSQIIEIEATIIDVDTNKLRELGVEWRYADDESSGEVMFGGRGTKADFVDTLTGGSVQLLDQIPGFQIGAIVGDKSQFITRVNALQREGVVSVSSRPKVATLNDMEAVIESSRSLYVPVEGAYEVDLFQVFSGTVLRVTPHVIETDEHTQIRLIVAVEDGNVDMLEESEMPVTTRHAVTTQAVINAGYSLLLGGLVREEETSSVSKVPLLGDIPVLGRLFRSESKRRQSAERLFLISPRIKLPDGSEDMLSRLSDTKSGAGRKNTGRWPESNKCQGDCREELGSDSLLVF
ncbi:type III secretion system outer membrane ring subunit SctC [Hahella ganghwensis]|uniref:type III secretion system outer membrane ring subunit SctC n=1 Tax=Hahella ganghwensis TaxID=286420 RepID=UPI00035DB8EB|nr:type III secretion system outer membrane ring subunit SctC [Hahella ganghwensis]